MFRLMRFKALSIPFLLMLFALLPLTASAATYTFSGSSFPPCSTWNGAWSQSGTTFTCDASASLAAGDIIAPAAGSTVIAQAGWTLAGNNTVGSTGAPVTLRSGHGDIQIGSGLNLRGNLVSDSGDMTVLGSSTINGNVSSSSGQLTLTSTVVTGSLTTGDLIVLSGGAVSGSVSGHNGVTTSNGTNVTGNVVSTGGPVSLSGGTMSGNVTGRSGVTATNGVIFTGNVHSSNGSITLSGGYVIGSVISNCCVVQTTNTNISGGVRSDNNTVNINGGMISGGVYSSGGSGIIISNAVVTNGDITSVNVPILISDSNIGSPVSLIDVESNNNITIRNSQVNGSVIAGGWQGSLVVEGDSDVTIICYPEPYPPVPGVCDGTGGGRTIDHYELDLPPAGLTCENTILAVRACATNAAPCTASLAAVSTTTTLTASAGSFINSGGATIGFTGNGAYVLSVMNPTLVNFGLTAPAGANLQCFRFEGTTRTPTACQLDVKNSMFRFAVPDFSAGDGATFTIEAVRQDDHARKCVSFVPDGGVKMWTEYVNPASGSKTLSLGHGSPQQVVSLPATEPASGNVPLQFDAQGAALAGVNYLDAGQVKLKAKWNATEGESLFVVKPYFAITDLKCADDTPNPGATGPSGARFCRAGQAFSATVRAVTSDRTTPTPNFGSESPPESLVLTASQVSPAALPVPPGVLTGGASLVKRSNAPSIADGDSLIWSEVGVIALTPGIADSDYLGAGNVTNDAVVVGRFYPHHFSTQITPPMDCPASSSFDCPGSRAMPAKGIGYAGQPFRLTVSARNANGDITRNYAGSTGYAKAGALAAVTTPGSDAAPGGEGSGTLSAGTLSAASFADGEAVLTDARYAFSTPPGTPTDIHLRASETGGDGVSSKLTPAASSEEGGIRIVQGRIRLTNVVGNGKSPLDMPVEAQLWSGKSWVRSTSDNTILPLESVISNPALPGIGIITLAQGSGKLSLPATPAGSHTIGINLGAAGASFASCDAALSGGTPAQVPWLRSRSGTCAESQAYAADPAARATFGIYAPETRKMIHVRERY